jgi:hypothetical protein
VKWPQYTVTANSKVLSDLTAFMQSTSVPGPRCRHPARGHIDLHCGNVFSTPHRRAKHEIAHLDSLPDIVTDFSYAFSVIRRRDQH